MFFPIIMQHGALREEKGKKGRKEEFSVPFLSNLGTCFRNTPFLNVGIAR